MTNTMTMTDTQSSTQKAFTGATDPKGPTGILATWAASMSLDHIPDTVQQRAKYLLLDGIGCLLVGSHLDWSALGVEAITDFDPSGEYMIAAWGGKKTSAYSAAMLNSSFIQGFELDDYYPAAPLHSNAILLPAMLPVLHKHPNLTGKQFLLALILGYETGTRIGLALHGTQMLSRGWHSGVVFGCAAAAVSAGKLMGLSAAAFEDAIGIGSTQACGLMSAQFESMIKRMQHGLAARNGLYGAVLAERGYVGIKRVLEREYGGFLPVFGEGHSPDASQVTTGLGSRWITTEIAVKPYSALAFVHAGIDAALALRAKKQIVPDQVLSILIEVGDAAFDHGGFPIQRPIEPITAQMSLRYSVAVALLDGAALIKQFAHARIESDDVWNLIDKTHVHKVAEYEQKPHTPYTTQVTIVFTDGSQQRQMVETPTGGAGHPLSNEAIAAKFNTLTDGVAAKDRIDKLQDLLLNIEKQEKAVALLDLLEAEVANVLA
jgi:aconitate decarboxylase